MHLREIQRIVFIEYKKNGFLSRWQRASKALRAINMEGVADIAEIGLFTEEVGEAFKPIMRKNMGGLRKEALKKELADIIIRVLNFASRHHIDMQEAIIEKHQDNMRRKKLHSKLF